MSHNKGKRYIKCPKCDRKRYCNFFSVPNSRRKWVCSKRHEWIVDLPTIERISAIMQEVLIPKLKNIFERDDTFYRSIKRK